MAATNSGHRHHHNHPPNFLVTDRRTYPTEDEDSDDFESWNTNYTDDEYQEKAISKPTVTKSRKLPRKTHRRNERTVAVGGKSLPVNIPEWSKILRDSETLRFNGDDVDGDGGDDEWLPPHEYLARIRSASLSVHEGVGRTLKGRDLRRLRNAIWKQTGFELD
ncbi:hypothetical protein L1987_81607 [Smallanthus sonchifolius]|uniref:Uncharacterized protein n=1 Tax=Smallanthus sonchifolius TaxID=185202 RepID=A0ACB8YRD0_9ASTR|nr:hypothetical protein L1987_81607 [Smallanthus sonchifolius]